jgi:F0F1-type ATP synthase assembly protein I
MRLWVVRTLAVAAFIAVMVVLARGLHWAYDSIGGWVVIAFTAAMFVIAYFIDRADRGRKSPGSRP